MRIVLDSNVALKVVLPEADSDVAIELVKSFHAGIHTVLAPEVFHIEVAHALTRAERQKRIPDGSAWPLWQSVMADCPQLFDSAPLMKRAIQLSSEFRVGIYDCLYVALAEQENCNLVTADARLVNSMPGFNIMTFDSL